MSRSRQRVGEAPVWALACAGASRVGNCYSTGGRTLRRRPPSHFAYLHEIKAPSPFGSQLPLSDAQELSRLGLTLDFYAWLNLCAIVLNLLVYIIVGTVIFLRKSDDRMVTESMFDFILYLVLIASLLAFQVDRYRRVSPLCSASRPSGSFSAVWWHLGVFLL